MGLEMLMGLIVLIALYLVMSLAIMMTWNKGVKPALKTGSVNTITYPQAMALTFFLAMVCGGSVVVLQPSMRQAMTALPTSSFR